MLPDIIYYMFIKSVTLSIQVENWSSSHKPFIKAKTKQDVCPVEGEGLKQRISLTNLPNRPLLISSHSDNKESHAKLKNIAMCYLKLVYTKTVDSIKGALWLTSQTPNILCHLRLSNSGKNGIPVGIHDKRNHPN